MSHLPDLVLSNILPFIDYINGKYSVDISINEDLELFRIFDVETSVFISKKFIVGNVKLRIAHEVKNFNRNNDLYNLYIYYGFSENNLFNISLSVEAKIHNRIQIYKFTQDMKEKYLSKYKLELVDGLYCYKVSRKIYHKIRIQIVDKLTIPDYSKYVKPTSIEHKNFRIIIELQKYFQNNIVYNIISYHEQTVML